MIINPYVHNDGVISDIYSQNLNNRVVHLVGEITDEQASSIVAQLLYLDSVNNDEIQMYINSPGGSVTAGLTIYDTMQFIKSNVATVCLGCAASMAAVILSGGAKGKRAVLPHSQVMIHQPWGGISGQAADIEIAADHIRMVKEMLSEILCENCNKDLAKLKADMDRDHWLRADEAVAYGIADMMVGSTQESNK